ncbi:MAG: alpha/beta fold hydrolase [Flavobacteriales bacterium]
MLRLILCIPLAALVLAISSCQKEQFTLSGMANDHFFLRSGYQHMPITVAGNTDSKKFVIIIHGGPGGSAIQYRTNYVRDHVENDVVMVYWDQRFAGNTQGNNGNSGISQFRIDIKNVILLLQAKYGSDKEFYLLAHSWGGFLAPYFLAEGNNQQLVKGWIQVDGAHNYFLNDSLTREMLICQGNIEISEGRNEERWQEIVDWCQANDFKGEENGEQLNRFAFEAESLMEQINQPSDPAFAEILQTSLMSFLSNIAASIIRNIDSPAYEIPNSDKLHIITVPTLLLWGKYDFVCPPELATDILNNTGSQDVDQIIYENSGHSPMLNEPEKFWNDVTTWVTTH